jgi:hypothetical protein
MDSDQSLKMNLGVVTVAATQVAQALADALHQSHPSGFDFDPIKEKLLAGCVPTTSTLTDEETASLIEVQRKFINILFAAIEQKNAETPIHIN